MKVVEPRLRLQNAYCYLELWCWWLYRGMAVALVWCATVVPWRCLQPHAVVVTGLADVEIVLPHLS